MQQAWKRVKEVKIESVGDNIFLFKFATEEEKKRVFIGGGGGGAWHFDISLLVLTEVVGIGGIKDQSFTHASSWVQMHNIPIMCMNRVAIRKIGEKIGIMQEIETDKAGECIGQFAHIRVSIDITQPLKKVVFLQGEGSKIPMPILYEKLPNFCFCCAHIGHQYRECFKYMGQQKEDLPYGEWMRAVTQAERVKQNRMRERTNREQNHSNTNNATVSNPGTNEGQQNPIGQNGSYPKNLGAEPEKNATQPSITQKQGGAGSINADRHRAEK